MTTFRTLIAASILSSSLTSAVMAQADRTGTGGGPLSTEKAPNTTVVGQTKPPSRDASPTSVKPIGRPTPRQVADDAISHRICIGCAPGTSETGALIVPIPVITVQKKRDVQLEDLRSAPQPEQQADLDTVTLASAHREQAKSTEEKTNGLWQSWLVSVCRGCGDQKPAKAFTLKDWPNRDVPITTGSIEYKSQHEKAQFTAVKRAEISPNISLEADISSDKLKFIRLIPQK